MTNDNIADINTLKPLQLFQSIGLFIIPPFVIAYFCSNKPMPSFLQLNKKVDISMALLIVAFMIASIPFVNLLSELNQQLALPKAFQGIEAWMKSAEAETAQLTERMVQVNSIAPLLFNILLIAILPAFGEELFFRGTIQTFLQPRYKAIAAVWITAFVFSAIHMQFYGFVPRLLLGAFFGYLTVWSSNLWYPIIGHFTNNVLAVIFYYLKFNGYLIFNLDKIGTGNTLWLGIVSLIIIVGGVILIRRKFVNELKLI